MACSPFRDDLVREPPKLSATGPASGGAASQPWSPDPDRGPAANPLPFAPPIEPPDPTARFPRPRELGRNELVSDRFYAAGQRVRYALTVEAGELALLELWTYGYARGWRARTIVEVVRRGRSYVRRSQELGPTGRLLVPFVAPEAGTYELVVNAASETFRYHLVRHSNFEADDGAVELGDRTLARGWLDGGASEARFGLTLAADESVAVRVRSTREADRAAEVDFARSGAARSRDEGTATRGDVPLTPTFGLAVDGEHRPWRLLWLRPGPARDVELVVRAQGTNDGGFFDLLVERNPRTAQVCGVVVDGGDEPVPGVQLEFLREPELAPVARTRTGDDGTYDVEVMTGPYRIQYGRGRARDDARTQVAEDREINLIWLPRL